MTRRKPDAFEQAAFVLEVVGVALLIAMLLFAIAMCGSREGLW